jgi:hypothetical protein
MGCSVSKLSIIHPEVAKNKENKRLTLELTESIDNWQCFWMEFTDSVEQCQLAAAHWIQDETGLTER